MSFFPEKEIEIILLPQTVMRRHKNKKAHIIVKSILIRSESNIENCMHFKLQHFPVPLSLDTVRQSLSMVLKFRLLRR